MALALLAGDPELVLVAALGVLHTMGTSQAVVSVCHVWSSWAGVFLEPSGYGDWYELPPRCRANCDLQSRELPPTRDLPCRELPPTRDLPCRELPPRCRTDCDLPVTSPRTACQMMMMPRSPFHPLSVLLGTMQSGERIHG